MAAGESGRVNQEPLVNEVKLCYYFANDMAVEIVLLNFN